jgi:cytoskeletal protein CcmA (bactofilin family)
VKFAGRGADTLEGIERGEAGMWNRDVLAHDESGRAPQAPSSAAPGLAPEERRRVAWVGKSVVFRGDLISLEDMTIDGRVEGTIEIRDHTLTVGPEARIQADIVAKTVTVLGIVTGTIAASETVTISETGTVEGDITCPRLAMAEGGVVRGRVDTRARDADETRRRPDVKATV